VKVEVQDVTALRALKPLEMAAYLRSQGWREEVDLNGKGNVWLLRDREGVEFDVALPLRREFRDYALRMQELLRTLSEAEQRSQLDILRDVLTTTSDLVRIRASGSEGESGTLPLEQAVAFVEHSRDLMLAAACAALDKRAYFAKRKPQQAMDYLQHVRMGQTEQGSYVLTILSPVAPELRSTQADLPLGEPAEPYERHVTRTLMQALSSLDGAARRAAIEGAMTPFNEAVKLGVSANLCEAVVGLSAVSPGEGLDVQVSWSRTRPVGIAFPKRVRLESDSIAIIEEAARHFRQATSMEDFEVTGFITRLDRDHRALQGEM
jgi:hypothetical protein